MKLHAILKNERGGAKSSSDDIRLRIELRYKNEIVGEVSLYSVSDGNEDLGYRLLLNRDIIKEKVKR